MDAVPGPTYYSAPADEDAAPAGDLEGARPADAGDEDRASALEQQLADVRAIYPPEKEALGAIAIEVTRSGVQRLPMEAGIG